MALLQLRPGDQVLDLGCGGGGSFPYLVDAVGPAGKVVGVDISIGSCINARRRVEHNGWKNVDVHNTSADVLVLPCLYDGALMFAAPDIFSSPQALNNILPSLKSGARLVFFGAKLSHGRMRWILNPFFLFMCRHLSPNTPAPVDKPWEMLGHHLDDLVIHDYFQGSMFLASGTMKNTAGGSREIYCL